MRAKRDLRVYLYDILAATEVIERYTEDGEDRFLSDTMVQDAVIRQLSIIGEAATKLPTRLKEKHPHIPWKKIIGMRNVLIHDYSETDIPTVWDTVKGDLPDLRRAVERMVPQTERSEKDGRKAA